LIYIITIGNVITMADTEKRTSIAATPRRRTKKEKEILQNKTNQENLTSAIVTLENINRNHYREVNRIIKSRINELLALLKDNEQKFSLSVRAANAVSILDKMTQDKAMKSHIRTMLWQVVSNLEGIRE
jgi:uncharacterized protein (UPF0147 family)